MNTTDEYHGPYVKCRCAGAMDGAEYTLVPAPQCLRCEERETIADLIARFHRTYPGTIPLRGEGEEQ